ncbi:homeobox protein dve-1-like [Oppia nitens]|uniref:homeobox protein dve-1-like n=1 Tax=Oppia nitens TaxID=1686743 RepID=UPI0023DA27FD|nr:homeobox protein dve-1-like [Oppia nitens]
MDFQSMMETFAEAWVAANVQTPLTEAVENVGRNNAATIKSSTNLPVHCLVERVSSPANNASTTTTTNTTLTGTSASSASMGTFDVLTGHTSGTTSSSSVDSTASSLANSLPVVVEQDTYAIIPSAVPFHDLVRTALLKLGYTSAEIVGAKGVIQLKNWKPLTFDQISDNSEATVADILGDISSVATLRIRLYRPRMNAAHELKDKLLQLLLAHSYSLLANSGCPIDQQMLNGLCRPGMEQEINDETRGRFDQWYLQQVFNHYRQVALASQPQPQHQPNTRRQTVSHPLLIDMNQTNGEQLHQNLAMNGSTHSPDKHPALMTISPPSTQSHHNMGSVRTRIRTSFDPELELPKLHRWFQENRHPSRAQVMEYVKELNSLESRKGRKPLDINNVVYWFKNARAAHKRAELKFVGDSTGVDGLVNDGSPGKTGSDISGKCMDDSNRNGSAIDDYYSMDEDGDSSHEATQTLDLSMRSSKRMRSESPTDNDGDYLITAIKHEDDIHSNDMNSCSNNTITNIIINNNNNDINSVIKVEQMDRNNDGSSDLSEAEDSDEEREYFDNSYQTNSQINNNLTNNMTSLPESPDGRRIRRSRTFIDPMSEVPRLEHWFSINTHPAHSQIVRYTEELNNLAYRRKFPKLEPKNIQFWFKNRRAKFKRNLSMPTPTQHPTTPHHTSPQSSALNIERLINAH